MPRSRPGREGRPARTTTPIIDQHATWIAVNPVQGCPKGCAYCFLNDRGQTSVRPQHLARPAEAADLLAASPYYAADRPVALYTWTDVMALPDSRTHLEAMLAVLAARALPNPIVLITKCHVPDATIDAIASARRAGLRVIVYLSYSGLGPRIERGIRAADVKANFPRLAGAGIPVVHYWRPAFPESADTAVMESVLDWAAEHAACTVAAGLKVEGAALGRLAALWPQLAAAPGVLDAEGVYPRPFWDFIHAAGQRHPGYPLFHASSCALAWVLSQPERHGVFGTGTCRVRSHCPAAQRQVCAAAPRPAPDDGQVAAALSRRGYPGAAFTIDLARGEVTVSAPVATTAAAALTRDLGMRIRVARQDGDPYWASGTAGAAPLVIE